MTLFLLLLIVVAAMVVFIGGWVRVDVVGLLVLALLAITGLVTAEEALAGFSSPAVVTVWAMFILSAGLTRTGLAHRIGQPLLHLATRGEATLIVALMGISSLLSALINTVTVAAILLPTTMELARRSGRPPSRLLLPLALGCLLGGPFTGISTPPNILITEALAESGLEPFGIFDFTPITGAVVLAGILFVATLGRRLLPTRTRLAADPGADLRRSYQLAEHVFTTSIRPGSKLDGRTLAESRLGSALHLTVLAIERNGKLELGPGAGETLRAGDVLVLHGRPGHLARFHGSQHLRIESPESIPAAAHDVLRTAYASIPKDSPLIGLGLDASGLRARHRVHLLDAVAAGGERVPQRNLRQYTFARGDRLQLLGEPAALARLEELGVAEGIELDGASGSGKLLPVRVPEGSVLVDDTLLESRLGSAFGLTVAGIVRGAEPLIMPSPQEPIRAGDVLLLLASPRDLEILQGLQELEIAPHAATLVEEVESQEVGTTEILLSPRTRLAGRTLGDLLFRDHYGLTVLAIWREGKALRQDLQDKPLHFGDALLVYGHRRRLAALARDPDFLVLDPAAARPPRLDRAGIAAAIMIAVVASAMAGLLPIAIAALTGATLMVLAGCLRMDEAYQAIEWKVVFLIAAMLPLGTAIQTSGAAELATVSLLDLVGDFDPRWVIAALFAVTAICTQFVPTAALVVLMSPIALGAAASLDISPHLLMMTVAIAASASFASPLSHPANLLVMGPGGYRFVDYVKIGVPVTLVALAVAVGLLPVLWPP